MHNKNLSNGMLGFVIRLLNMRIDVSCPQCKKEGLSKLRKITAPGIFSTCKLCETELGVESMFSAKNVLAIIIALPLIKLASASLVYSDSGAPYRNVMCLC